MDSNAQSHQSRRVKKVPPGAPRARSINSCLTCRDRKKGCDKRQPVCGNCSQNPDPNKPCVYAHGKAEVLKAHKRKLQSLKEDFAISVANGATHDGSKFEETPNLNSLIVSESAFEEGAENDCADLGIRLGKSRISDRVDGFFRPKMVEELTNALNNSAQQYPGEAVVPQYLPLSSGFTDPGSAYMEPGIYDFCKTSETRAKCLYFPEKITAEILLSQYWERVHPVARVLHRPSFEEKWNVFWNSHQFGMETEKSLLALVFAVVFSGLVSMPEDVVLSVLRFSKKIWMEKMRAATDFTLAQSNWISSTKVEMLQAVVIYLISVCHEEVSQTHSNIVAAAIRAAEGIGLHEDGTHRSYPAVQSHVRRLLWYQLLVLDIRTCEATGPRPQIREGDYSSQLPLNVDDDLVHLSSDDSESWTDMTVTIIKIRCNEFIREIWTDRLCLKEQNVSIGEILIKIQAFDAYIQGKYGKMANQDVPIQRYGCLVAKIQILRTYSMVLHEYTLHPKFELSENLKKIFIKYGVETMDAVKELETAQDLVTWRWLASGLQQHHEALAMLLELLRDPYFNQAIATMKSLDYLFELPQHLGLLPLTRVRCIVTELRDRMNYYVTQRKLHTPNSLYDIGNMPALEQFESPTSSNSTGVSPTPQENSSPIQLSDSTDDQLADATTCSSKVPAYPLHHLQASPRQIIDMDEYSLRVHFPDIVDTDLVMSSEDRHTAYEAGGYSLYISKQNQLSAQWDPINSYVHHSQPRDNIQTRYKAKCGNMSMENYDGDNPIDNHTAPRSIGPYSASQSVTGYRTATPVTPDRYSPGSHTAAPVRDYLQGQDCFDAPVMYQQQQTSIMPTNRFPGSQPYQNSYSNSKRQGTLGSQDSYGGYAQQSAGAQYGM